MQRTALNYSGVRYRIGLVRAGDSCVRCRRGPFRRSVSLVDPTSGQGLCHSCVRDLVDPLEWAWLAPSFATASKERKMADRDAEYWDLSPDERYPDDDAPAPEPEELSLEEAIAEIKRIPTDSWTVFLVPGRQGVIEVKNWGDMYVAQSEDGTSTYIEASNPVDLAGALYSTGVTSALEAARSALTAIANGQKPSLTDHIRMGTFAHMRKALNLPGAGAVPTQDSLPDAPILPDPELVPRTTKPGVTPASPASPPPLSGDQQVNDPDPDEVPPSGAREDLPSTAQVQAMRVRVAASNPGLSETDVDSIVHDALVLAWGN